MVRAAGVLSALAVAITKAAEILLLFTWRTISQSQQDPAARETAARAATRPCKLILPKKINCLPLELQGEDPKQTHFA